AGLAAIAIGLAGPRYATGTWIPQRMLAVAYVLALHFGLVLVFLTSRGERGLPRAAGLRGGAMLAAVLVLAAALALRGNGAKALEDLADGRTQRWSRNREERYALVRAARARGQRELVVPPSPPPPRIFVPMDIRA